ncbi:hypothetical protein DOY81_002320 [Sarcophaga bullata]|nr:hypothetical protein DOY81_002320 [Sarcophaga bullata]
MSCCGPRPKPNNTKFNADYRSEAVTDKFYSSQDNEKGIDKSRILYYEKEIDKLRKYDARCHSMVPRYANQTYGWLPGYKIRFLQTCDKNIYDNPAFHKISKELVQHHFKGPKLLIDHCACKKLVKASRDFLKIN